MKREPKLTEAQILLGKHLEELAFAGIRYEFRFNNERKWRADVAAWAPNDRYSYCLFECDGGMFRGGHRRAAALEADYERQNWAAAKGFKLFRFTNREILTGKAKQWLQEHLL